MPWFSDVLAPPLLLFISRSTDNNESVAFMFSSKLHGDNDSQQTLSWIHFPL